MALFEMIYRTVGYSKSGKFLVEYLAIYGSVSFRFLSGERGFLKGVVTSHSVMSFFAFHLIDVA